MTPDEIQKVVQVLTEYGEDIEFVFIGRPEQFFIASTIDADAVNVIGQLEVVQSRLVGVIKQTESDQSHPKKTILNLCGGMTF